jgi:hypothetical protein
MGNAFIIVFGQRCAINRRNFLKRDLPISSLPLMPGAGWLRLRDICGHAAICNAMEKFPSIHFL